MNDTDQTPRLGFGELARIVVWLAVIIALSAAAAGVIAFAVRLGWGK